MKPRVITVTILVSGYVHSPLLHLFTLHWFFLSLSLPTLKSLHVYMFMSRECDIHVHELHVHACHTLSFVASLLFHFFPPSPLPPDPNRDLCITTLSGVFLLNLQEYGFLIHCDQKYINLHERVSAICTYTLCLQPVKLHKHTHYAFKSMLVPLTSWAFYNSHFSFSLSYLLI